MLYTPEYQKQQAKLHAKGNYGVVAGLKYGKTISGIVDRLKIDHLLDYGCGSNLSLREGLKPQRPVKYQAYDPAVPEYADSPVPAELVCCVDVLEHIEPDCLEDVLDHLEELTQVILFASIHTGPAMKVLDDGRNAHLNQKPMQWWLPKLWDRFAIQTVQVTGPEEFFVIGHNSDLVIEE